MTATIGFREIMVIHPYSHPSLHLPTTPFLCKPKCFCSCLWCWNSLVVFTDNQPQVTFNCLCTVCLKCPRSCLELCLPQLDQLLNIIQRTLQNLPFILTSSFMCLEHRYVKLLLFTTGWLIFKMRSWTVSIVITFNLAPLTLVCPLIIPLFILTLWAIV